MSGRIRTRGLAWGLMALAMAAWPAMALAEPANAAGIEYFEKYVRPLLAEKCFQCHGEDKQKGSLRLDSPGHIRLGGDSGEILKPGNVEGSRIIEAIRYRNADLQMPPKGALPPQMVAVLEEWVSLGAPMPDDGITVEARKGMEVTEEDRQFWSFRPVTRPELPEPKAKGWAMAPIDRFILAQLEDKGLEPAPPADKRTLIRRASFDLTGLPPTPEEISDFLADDSPDAFRKVVDRLLDSPHYGERWARHWLDVMRFAETNGHNRDPDKPNMWRYRDYVIDAFNEDLPYDEFLVEQLAGDLLPPRPDRDGLKNQRLIATGGLWSYELVYNPEDPRQQRADQVDAQIDIVTRGMLGMTVTCARCHDHKTDPVPTTDYYALAGFFYSTKGVQRPVSLEWDEAAARDFVTGKQVFLSVAEPRLREVRGVADYLLALPPLLKLDQTKALTQARKVAVAKKLDAAILERWVRYAFTKDAPRNPNLGPFLQLAKAGPEPGEFQSAAKAIHGNKKGAIGDQWWNVLTRRMMMNPSRLKSLETLARGYEEIMVDVLEQQAWEDNAYKQWLNWFMRDDTPYRPEIYRDLKPDEVAAIHHLRAKAKGDLYPKENIQAMACADAGDPRFEVYQSRVTSIPEYWSLPRHPKMGSVPVMKRGQLSKPGEEAPRGFLAVLPAGGPVEERIEPGTSGRLELAKWIASPENPLTTRVIVNRLWQHHFGRGLVDTPDDFGRTGSAPSHPELLDYLASRFVELDWSMKAMHRELLLSRAYQMSSETSPRAEEIDPDNRLLSHMPVRRLEAESVRDAILAVSGSLDATLGGPGVQPHITEFMYPRFHPKSGPVDGHGRRSVYITVRRNFLTPILLAFDFPNPSEPVGRRNISNVPTQALALMNNEFVHQQAEAWGERIVADRAGHPEGANEGAIMEVRTAGMFECAVGRPPTDEERGHLVSYLSTRQVELDAGLDDPRLWSELGHVLFNTKAFLFVR